ncbi:MAG: HD domain-containing phosphohydrolase [Fervidobacterium nodosum]
MKKLRSLKKCMNFNMYLITILFAFLLFIIIFDVFQHKEFQKTYVNIRAYFNLINDVVVGRKNFDELLVPMRNVSYKYEEFAQVLEDFKNGKIDKEEVLNYVRDFASYLRSYEEKKFLHINNVYKFSSIFVVFGVIIMAFFGFQTRRFKKHVDKVIDNFQQIARNVNISAIPLPKIEYEEDLEAFKAINEINNVQNIYDTIKHIPLTSTIEDFVFNIGPYLCSLFNSQRFSVALIDWESKTITAEVAYTKDPNKKIFLKAGFKQSFDETSLGKMISENIQFRIINDLSEHFQKTNSVSTKLILQEGFQSNLTVLTSINSRPFGFIFLSSERKNNYTERDARLLLALSNVISYRFYYSIIMQNLISNLGSSFVDLVEFRDNETGKQSKRVALYSKIIAEKLGLQPRKVREIYQFTPLHDIGKVGIPDAILLKPARLTDEEMAIMRKHVEIGEEVLRKFSNSSKNFMETQAIEVMINIISDHHEKFDGSGYPRGKKGEEISIEGRIVALADVFDALTTKRPYKEPFDFDVSLEMIVKEKGKHFDPNVVDAFLSEIDKIRKVYEEFKD